MRGNKPRFECAVEIDSKENNLATKATAGGTSKTWSDAANGRNHLLPFGVTCYVLYYIYMYMKHGFVYSLRGDILSGNIFPFFNKVGFNVVKITANTLGHFNKVRMIPRIWP